MIGHRSSWVNERPVRVPSPSSCIVVSCARTFTGETSVAGVQLKTCSHSLLVTTPRRWPFPFNLQFEMGSEPPRARKTLRKNLLVLAGIQTQASWLAVWHSTHCVTVLHLISLLPITSKLFEKLLLVRLKIPIGEDKLIPDHQFGFRNNYSTIEQVNRVYNVISNSIEEKKRCKSVEA